MDASGMSTRSLQDRVKLILTDPKSEWPVIEREPTTVERLYREYIVILAALPAVAAFISNSIIGIPLGPYGTYRVGIVQGIIGALVTYVLTLVGVYVSAFVINKLAPTFDSTPNEVQALKLVAYASTASWVFGVGNIIPILGMLIALVGALYSIYLFYLGLPVMMKTPEAKVIAYMVIAAVVMIVVYFFIAILAGMVMGIGAMATPY